MSPSFKVSRVDAGLIRRIAARAFHSLQALASDGRCQLDLQMDLTACHANGCPLRLEELVGAGDASFAHDVLGIVRHIDRRTGRIDPAAFHPRYAAPVVRRPVRSAALRQRSFRRAQGA